jgi:hypothetical protein
MAPLRQVLYLHESVHPDYVAPPKPQRFQRPTVDAEGKEIPTLRQPRPKVYDPDAWWMESTSPMEEYPHGVIA